MSLLLLGLVLFIGTHLVSAHRGVRNALAGRLGEVSFKIGYAVLSLAGLVLVSKGYAAYRQDEWIPLWEPPLWTKHLALLLVWAAFVCLAAAYLPGRIKAAVKHPMLLAVKIWATAHLLANGDLGSLLLFGAFLFWAVVARISLKRRPPGERGLDLPPPAGAAAIRNDVLAVAIGTAAWFAFARFLHPLLIGVAVWPGA